MDLEALTPDVEVWLYGSRARGDADAQSDTDVLVIGDEAPALTDLVAALSSRELAVSFYTWQEVRGMWAYGSLFLEHIRAEGRRLRGSQEHPPVFPELLATLPPFTRARHDLTAFRVALDEGEASLANHGWPDLELQILATVARHAAILACYCVGQPTFGRRRPFEVWGSAAGWSSTEVRDLADGSVAYRFTPLGTAEWADLERTADQWLELLRQLLQQMEDHVDRYDATLLQAA